MKKIFGIVLFSCFVFASSVFAAQKSVDFTLPSIDGGEVTLSSFKGKKVLIDFFATWCPPCRKELKEINEIVNEYKDGMFQILCVSVDNDMATVSKFMKKNDYKMKTLFDDKNIAGQYGVTGVPTVFLVDEKGDITWSNVGYTSKEEILKHLTGKKGKK